LTQVYADFHPSPDLTWLGLRDWIISSGKGLLRDRVLNQRIPATVERIAVALQDLQYLYPAASPEKSAVDEAVASGGLVLTESPRAVYWDTKPIPADWERFDQPWKLLWALASKAHLRAAVEVRDVYGVEPVTDSALSTLVGRLKKFLPPGLWKFIEPTRQRSYRLCLDRARVHLYKKV
jgi:hypothetical protein